MKQLLVITSTILSSCGAPDHSNNPLPDHECKLPAGKFTAYFFLNTSTCKTKIEKPKSMIKVFNLYEDDEELICGTHTSRDEKIDYKNGEKVKMARYIKLDTNQYRIEGEKIIVYTFEDGTTCQDIETFRAITGVHCSAPAGKYKLKAKLISEKTTCENTIKINNEMEFEKGSEYLECGDHNFTSPPYQKKIDEKIYSVVEMQEVKTTSTKIAMAVNYHLFYNQKDCIIVYELDLTPKE